MPSYDATNEYISYEKRIGAFPWFRSRAITFPKCRRDEEKSYSLASVRKFQSGEETSEENYEEKEGEPLSMADNAEINFDAPATLRKWPSVNNERVSASLGANPYLIIDGTLDECIRKFMAMPVGQHHLYEIYTTPQSDLVSAILSAAHIVELARLRDFL